MATIQTRKRKDGSVGYTARIRIKRAGVIVHEEAKTFDGRRYKRNVSARHGHLPPPRPCGLSLHTALPIR